MPRPPHLLTGLSHGMDAETINAIADAVAHRLRSLLPPPGWPADRATVTEPEFAQLVGLGADYVRDLRMAGKIPHRRVGRRIIYAAEDLMTFLSQNAPGRGGNSEKSGPPA